MGNFLQQMRSIKWPAVLRVIGRGAMDLWDNWVSLWMVTMIWLLSVLTLVLAAPVTFGVYYMVHHVITTGEYLGIGGVWDGFKKYLGKSYLWLLANVAAGVIIYTNWVFYGQFEQLWAAALQGFVGIFAAYFWLTINFYFLPYLMEQENKSFKMAFKNAALTSLATPLFTLVLMVVCGGLMFLSVWWVVPLFLGLPILLPILGTRALEDRLIAFGLKKNDLDPREVA